MPPRHLAEPERQYLIEVQRKTDTSWLWLLTCDRRVQAVDIMTGYYARHYPDRTLRVRARGSTEVIARHNPGVGLEL